MQITSINVAGNYTKIQKKSNTFLSFRAVSIDPDSIYKQPNGIIISDGNKKINKLLNN